MLHTRIYTHIYISILLSQPLGRLTLSFLDHQVTTLIVNAKGCLNSVEDDISDSHGFETRYVTFTSDLRLDPALENFTVHLRFLCVLISRLSLDVYEHDNELVDFEIEGGLTIGQEDHFVDIGFATT